MDLTIMDSGFNGPYQWDDVGSGLDSGLAECFKKYYKLSFIFL